MEQLIQFIISPQLKGWFFILKITLIVISFGLFVSLIIFFNIATWWKRLIAEDMAEFFTYRPAGVRKVERAWNKIIARLETGLESEYKLAVIEAESILDETLNRMGYSGETLGERLNKLTSAYLPNLVQVQEAHRIRNNIVHDPDYRLTLDEARKAVAVYEKALRDLDAF